MNKQRFPVSYLKIAQNAAKCAGVLLRQRNDTRVLHSHGRDLKLRADVASEKMIVGYLQSRSSFSILSEERGMIGKRDPKLPLWVVDPLDGSFNYLKGIPLCAVSIGLWQGDIPLMGVVYDFNRDEMFSGEVGCGAWLNGRRITTSLISKTKEAVHFSGLPVNMKFNSRDFLCLSKQFSTFKKTRFLGSAALSLAYVANGRGDSYSENGIMRWDVAAGLAVLKAAGGEFEINNYSANANCLSVTASNGYIKIPVECYGK